MYELANRGVQPASQRRAMRLVLRAILGVATALGVPCVTRAADLPAAAAADEAAQLEAEVVSGIKSLGSTEDVAAIRAKIGRLQKIEESFPPDQAWRRQMTMSIKQDIERAAALDSEARRRQFLDGVRDLGRSSDRLRVSHSADDLKAVEGARVALGAVLGEDSFLCMMALESRADALIRSGRIAEAQTAVDQLTAVRARQYEPGHPLRAACSDYAGRLALEKKDWKRAEELFAGSLVARSKAMGAGHPTTITARLGLIRAAAGMDKFESASRQLAAFGDDWGRLLDTSIDLRLSYFPVAVEVHRGAGRRPDAQGCQENLVAALMKTVPRDHPRLRQEVLALRAMLAEQGKWDLVKQLEAFWQLAPQAAAGQPAG